MNPDNTRGQPGVEPLPTAPAVNVPFTENTAATPPAQPHLGPQNFQSYSSHQRKPVKKPIVLLGSFVFAVIVVGLFVYFAVNFYRKQTESLSTPSSAQSP